MDTLMVLRGVRHRFATEKNAARSCVQAWHNGLCRQGGAYRRGWCEMYQRILVAIDGTEPSLQALDEAIGLAKDQRAHLRIVSVLDLTPLFMGNMYLPNLDELLRSMHDTGESILTQAQNRAQRAGIEVETALLESDGDRISHVIVDEAVRSAADLVIVGTHGRHGIGHLLLGSVAEGVARSSTIPVLLVHPARSHSQAARHDAERR